MTEKKLFDYIKEYLSVIKHEMENKIQLEDPENKMIAIMQFREWVKHEIQTEKLKKKNLKQKLKKEEDTNV